MSKAKDDGKDDLLQRAYHWIGDLPGGGHVSACRAWPSLPTSMKEPCNCGRDKLLDDIARSAFGFVDSQTNGHTTL